jgi:predicted porin
MKRLLLAGAAAMVMPAVATAQSAITFDGTASLGYNFSNVDIGGFDVDLSGMSLDLDTDVGFSESFSVGLDFGIAATTIDAGGGLEIDLDLMSMAIEPVYSLSNGAYFGAYYRMGDLDLSLPGLPITFGIDSDSYGLFGGYENGPIWVEAFIGTSDSEPSLPGNIDIMDYGIAASYDISPDFDVFGSILRTDIDAGGTDLALTAFSIGADYGFGNGLAAYGSVGLLDIDLGPLGDFDATGLTLGVSYDLSDMASIPMVVNAEYSRTVVDLSPLPIDPEIDRFALGVTIPLGGGSSQPLNSNTSTARGDYRSAVAALVQSF